MAIVILALKCPDWRLQTAGIPILQNQDSLRHCLKSWPGLSYHGQLLLTNFAQSVLESDEVDTDGVSNE